MTKFHKQNIIFKNFVIGDKLNIYTEIFCSFLAVAGLVGAFKTIDWLISLKYMTKYIPKAIDICAFLC